MDELFKHLPFFYDLPFLQLKLKTSYRLTKIIRILALGEAKRKRSNEFNSNSLHVSAVSCNFVPFSTSNSNHPFTLISFSFLTFNFAFKKLQMRVVWFLK